MEHFSSKLLHIRNTSEASLLAQSFEKLMEDLGGAGLELLG